METIIIIVAVIIVVAVAGIAYFFNQKLNTYSTEVKNLEKHLFMITKPSMAVELDSVLEENKEDDKMCMLEPMKNEHDE